MLRSLEPGVVVLVESIPTCDFCYDDTPGPYDFATKFGPWGHGCEAHWKLYRASEGLGLGKGQLWITEEPTDFPPDPGPETRPPKP